MLCFRNPLSWLYLKFWREKVAGNWQEEYRTCALVAPRRREPGLLNDLQIELTSEMLPVRFFPGIRSHTNTADQPGGSDAAPQRRSPTPLSKFMPASHNAQISMPAGEKRLLFPPLAPPAEEQ